jgi:hypothetical protein
MLRATGFAAAVALKQASSGGVSAGCAGALRIPALSAAFNVFNARSQPAIKTHSSVAVSCRSLDAQEGWHLRIALDINTSR